MATTATGRPGFDEMYRAMAARDPAYDGIFVACVSTTGVFCRPSCPARLPLEANVHFVATVEEAGAAGYRPCRCCRPLDASARHPAWVRDLLSPGGERLRLTDKGLSKLGIHPGRARRYFRRHFGATFQAYQRAMRLGSALERLSDGRDGLRAGVEIGYDSSSGFRDAFASQFGLPLGRAGEVSCLQAREIPTPLRPMIAVASGRGVCLLEFLDRRALLTEMRRLRARFRAAIVPGTNPHLERLVTELGEYFAGTRRRFEVALDVHPTPFQRRVWARLQRIPYGSTVSYSRIAVSLNRPRAMRAVGRANGQNPIAIVIPCHRVVMASGSLCGYGGGLWRKRWLLDHERRWTQSTAPATEPPT